MEKVDRNERIFRRGVRSLAAALLIMAVAALPHWAVSALGLGFCVFALMNIIVALYDSRGG